MSLDTPAVDSDAGSLTAFHTRAKERQGLM